MAFEGAADLTIGLDAPLPRSLPSSRGTAILVQGTCAHPRGEAERLAVLVDGRRHDAAALGGRFWSVVPVPALEAPCTVRLAATAGGAELIAPLGTIGVEDAPPRPARGARISICMATWEPDMELFRRQVESLRAQTARDWICVISDDCSSPERWREIEREVAGDLRFEASRSERRLGFYRNFERVLAMVPADAPLVALCDQDDRWHPEKLERLSAALGSAQLVYSDQRLVDPDGRVRRETMWHGRRNNHTSLASMLVANTVTGASALFRREVAELALPFPDTSGYQFHDHWIALVALASGPVEYVDRPLYDYVQHAGAVFGDVSSGASARPRRPGPMTAGRAAYFHGWLPRAVQAEALLARCPELEPDKRRTLERLASADRSAAALAWLAARPLRLLAGRTETLGSEGQLALGLAWRRLADLGIARDTSRPPLDAFVQRRLRTWRARL